jgi:hypothetical protein
MYQTDKVFLIGLNCVMFLQHFLQNKKEEVKDKCKYKRAAQEKKSNKNQKCLHPLCPPYIDICLASLNLCWKYV